MNEPVTVPVAPPPVALVIVTGISGSGKSLAIRVLEDAGYFCIDNLPVTFVRGVVESLMAEGHTRIAVSIDARVGSSLRNLRDVAEAFRADGIEVKALFLNARTDSLVQRYSETRRRHPMAVSVARQAALRDDTDAAALPVAGPTLEESIEYERELMSELVDFGAAIDTSDLHPNTLRQWVRQMVGASGSDLTLLIESFAFKHGIPLDADLVFDVRCLPNPYYLPALRPLTGLDEPVRAYLDSVPAAHRMVDDVERFLRSWLPSYRREHRHYFTVAIGCTGGQHRSVYVSEALSRRLAGAEPVLVRHRALAALRPSAGDTGEQTR